MYWLRSTKSQRWEGKQGADHEGPFNVREFVPYLKGTGEAHLKQRYSVISFDFNVENKCGFGGRSWEFFVVIQVRNDGGL